MAKRPRVWGNLSPGQQKRYLTGGRKQGLTDPQIRTHYESGGSVAAWRGHRPRPGVSERQWRTLRAAAKAARLHQDVETTAGVSIILESMLAKGYTYDQILNTLTEKKDSRDTFRTNQARIARHGGNDAGWQPGRRRYFGRDQRADIELFYYH